MKWRKLVRIVHRDVGYTTAALVIAYSISGLAVNHIDDWNPNYRFEKSAVDVGPVPSGDHDAMQAHLIGQLALDPDEVRGRVMDSETTFRIFLPEGGEVRVDTRTGQGTMKRVHTRAVLYEVNVLHLNTIKGVWTWVADLFAIALLLLAVTGVLILKGRQGIEGRGKWFLAAGFLIPAGFIVYMYYGPALTGH